MIEEQTRKKAGRNQLGTQRYLRYVAAFDHVMNCYEDGYHLEAIAVLDSLIGDRLASRLGYLIKEEVPVRLTVGQLAGRLIDPPKKNDSPAETDSEFETVIKEIRAWVRERNRAMHATAKVIRDNENARRFGDLLESHRSIVEKGIELLQAFDKLDVMARQNNGKTPATWPYAFFPEKRSPVTPRRRKTRN